MSNRQRSSALSRRLAMPLSRRRLVTSLAAAGLAAPIVTAGRGAAATPQRTLSTSRQTARPAAAFVAKAIHFNPAFSDDPNAVAPLVDLIDRTELNALVVDVKEDGVYYDTGVQLFQDAGDVLPLYDVTDLLDTLRAHDIYAIARLVVFKDTTLAEARPDLAVGDATTGGVWHDVNGVAWVNPFAAEVREANADLAVELAKLGFAEIQFDYVRFPTDGDLDAMDFGRPVTEAIRTQAIVDFLGACGKKLAPTEARVGADVFGFTLLLDDLGIGQNVGPIAKVVDYVCPMVYPSHFPNGSIAVDGHPNDFPSETIAISMAAGERKLPDQAAKLRPWLQDFSLPGLREYGPADVRAQIDAAEAAGVGGWMVWNAANDYHETAFNPAE